MLALIIVIIVIAVYVYMVTHQQSYTDGVWSADRVFMRSQNLAICRFYIVGNRAVILMSDAEGTIYDSAYAFICTPMYRSWLAPFTGVVYYKLDVPGTIFTDMHITINTITNQMVMKNGDICVTMYKNGEESINYFRELAA
jgi:hypothetical protein